MSHASSAGVVVDACRQHAVGPDAAADDGPDDAGPRLSAERSHHGATQSGGTITSLLTSSTASAPAASASRMPALHPPEKPRLAPVVTQRDVAAECRKGRAALDAVAVVHDDERRDSACPIAQHLGGQRRLVRRAVVEDDGAPTDATACGRDRAQSAARRRLARPGPDTGRASRPTSSSSVRGVATAGAQAVEQVRLVEQPANLPRKIGRRRRARTAGR